jgi:hypothetical protein
MSNKSEWQFIVCAILFIVMGVIAFGSIVGPDSVRDFVRDFRKALFVLVAIPLLVIVWWDTHVQASKKRLVALGHEPYSGHKVHKSHEGAHRPKQ